MKKSSPLTWVPSLYFTEGLPYVIVMTVAVLLYKRLGLSNTENAFYTSWLYLPWVIKPLWSPIVDTLRTKRWWILAMQIVIGAALASIAFTLPLSSFFQWSLAFFWLMAFSSATHDIAADGFYMLELDEHDQSLYVGIRSLAYRLATFAGQGPLLGLAGILETYFQPKIAWSYTFGVAATAMFFLLFWHRFFLPHPQEDREHHTVIRELIHNFIRTFLTFIRKPQFGVALTFMLLYRLPEALLVKICPLFLNDPVQKGGLGLTTAEIGYVQGTWGVIGLIIGGILGGAAVARSGFKKWLWPMVAAISLPNAAYIFLAYFQPESLFIVNVLIFIEQFGYGFGFTAYMLYLMYFSRGESQTAHYAFCTGIMALSMMLPGMIAGWLQEQLNYLNFFILVMCLCPLTFLVASLIKINPKYGLKKTKNGEMT